ncbi:MAG TPA: hypothetical protein VLB02_01940 [Candidatus Paceibacterota bacterium]|nr:hypothetical protein [Candidatus Paceibacterota bacterium]
MKKLFSSLIIFTVFTVTAQDYLNGTPDGAGFLRKSEYGKHMDEEEVQSFSTSGNTLSISNLKGSKAKEYISAHTLQFLGESSTQAAFGNSKVIGVGELPAGTKISTMDMHGNHILRDPYPGERFYFHTSTGKVWFSLYCWNPVFVTITQPAPTNNNYVGGGNKEFKEEKTSCEISWKTGYAIYSQGRNDREGDMLVDASLYTRIQAVNQCCGGGGNNGGGSGASVYNQASETVRYVQVQNGGGGNTFGSTLLGSAIGTFAGHVVGELLMDGRGQPVIVNQRQGVVLTSDNGGVGGGGNYPSTFTPWHAGTGDGSRGNLPRGYFR